MTDAKLLLAALTGLMPELDTLNRYPPAQTSAVLPRYKHPSELDAEKKARKRREIAEWNERVKK